MNGLFPKLALVSLIGLAGCANSTTTSRRAPTKFDHVQFSATIGGLLFFDQDTGNIWLYQDPQKPAVLLSRLNALGEPMVGQQPPANPSVTGSPTPAAPAKTPAATAPLEANASKLVAHFNALPKELWPSENETQAVRDARRSWLLKNPLPDSETITGVISEVSSTPVFVQKPDGSNDTRYVLSMSIDAGHVVIWGQEAPLHVSATFNSKAPEDGLKWKKGQQIRISGKISSATPSSAGLFGLGTKIDDISVDVTDAKILQ